MLATQHNTIRVLGAVVVCALVLGACSSTADTTDTTEDTTETTEDTTDTTEDALEAAKQSWIDARDDYGPTEAFRFYSGPIDNEDDGVEGQINAWPLDEAYIDYVGGDNNSGIINNADVIVELNEKDGETNVSTGWHAIEFLLWGQDLDTDGPGDRPVEDYTTSETADRRGDYLVAASAQLIEDLDFIKDAWAPDSDNYRAEFESLDTGDALTKILTGVGELSRGELAGERLNVAYTERSQEDEHSCFADNTTADIVGNALGIEIVLTGTYPGAEGVSILSLIEQTDAELATTLTAQLDASVAATKNIPAPFDQHLVEGVSDDDPGRVSILTAIEALETQTDTIVDVADLLGVPINVS